MVDMRARVARLRRRWEPIGRRYTWISGGGPDGLGSSARKRIMYPYIHIGSLQLGTFGILLWLAAVAAIAVMQKTFTRDGVDADALNIVTLSVLFGIIGAKIWHELQDPAALGAAMHQIGQPGWGHAGQVVMGFLRWFQAGFAWFGGLLAAIGMLLYQGVQARPNGFAGWRAGVRMLDLSAAAAAVGVWRGAHRLPDLG